ncbi:hypothetical protein BDP27DRAFT_1318279 [Rhodocollybia butyracea]|uniref:F-box domain-containing protein n=1 Tax=Rhodocollybia butyracea TaxID=206335 RepID=A0A9P5UB92_9AGAR|nr:hypothetical protein BDP27DRAFT_1318279 [Rhodocollybia butyracea]
MDRGRRAALSTEIAVVDAQLEILQRREAEIQRVLDEMTKMRDSVAAERQALETKRRELHGQTQPINWLPSELLIEIFESICSSSAENVASSIEDQSTIVALSHTCSKWRELALSTSRLWSFIHCPCTGWDEDRVLRYLERSGDAPLDVVCGAHGCWEKCTPHSRALSKLKNIILDNISRLRYLSVECMAVDTLAVIVELLRDKDNSCLLLSSLSLSVTREAVHRESFPGARIPFPESLDAAEQSGVLKKLKLHRIPLLSIPVRFYSSLTTLDISVHSKVLPNVVSLQSLLDVLCITRQLIEFSLSVYILAVREPMPEMEPVLLPHLKRVDLSCGHSIALPRFFSHINAPALEKIEFWLNDSSGSPMILTSPTASESRSYPSKQGLHLASLKDLCLQYHAREQDSLGSSVRNFTFNFLESLEIVNTDLDVRDSMDNATLPPLPRFESFFRDPRFPHLTHLSLSHFDIDDSRIEALLGYIPALKSLSLDTINNCMMLVDSLALKATRVAPGQVLGWTTELMDTSRNVPHHRRSMKYCPCLESLSLWECDLDFLRLQKMLDARNDHASPNEDEDADAFTTIRQSPNNTGSKRPIKQLPARRIIKPLRRTKLALEGEYDTSSSAQSSSGTVLVGATVLQAMRTGAARPSSRISYLRLAGCKGVDKYSARMLGEWVNDVVWSKS